MAMKAKSSIESGLDLFLSLLYAKGSTRTLKEEVSDTTRLIKLLYLLVQEGGFSRLKKDLVFEAKDFGPWSGDAFDAIEALKEMELVKTQKVVPNSFDEIADYVEWVEETPTHHLSEEEKQKNTYYLTKKGEKVAKTLYDKLTGKEKAQIEFVKGKFNKMELNKLLHYVYSKYPESTIKSKIRNKILK